MAGVVGGQTVGGQGAESGVDPVDVAEFRREYARLFEHDPPHDPLVFCRDQMTGQDALTAWGKVSKQQVSP